MNLRQYLRVNSSILGRAGDHSTVDVTGSASSRGPPPPRAGVPRGPCAVRSRSPDEGRSRDAGGMRAGPWDAQTIASQGAKARGLDPRALTALSVKVTRTLDSPVRPAGPAGISRISSVPYRSKYGLFSMPKRPTPLLRSHAVPERAGDIETTLRTHRHRQSSPHLPPMTPLNATQHAASATPGQQT